MITAFGRSGNYGREGICLFLMLVHWVDGDGREGCVVLWKRNSSTM